MSKTLCKSSNSMIAGVCGGIAEYLGWDPTLVRLLFVFVTILGGAGILIYVILLILMPSS